MAVQDRSEHFRKSFHLKWESVLWLTRRFLLCDKSLRWITWMEISCGGKGLCCTCHFGQLGILWINKRIPVCSRYLLRTLRWSFRAKSVINSAAVVSGDKIYFGSLDRNIYALNARTGELLWKHEMEGRIKTSPVIWGRYLLVPSEDRNLYAFGPISQENESH